MKNLWTHDALRGALRATACLAAATLLAACGSDDDDDAQDSVAVTLEVPASATASPAAWTQFSAALAASEPAEPLRMSATEPPTSETEEPQPL